MSNVVSSKYQIVIPKAVRKKVGIKPGQKMRISATRQGKVVLEKDEALSVDDLIQKYAGIARGSWGPDPVTTIRKMRDEEWD